MVWRLDTRGFNVCLAPNRRWRLQRSFFTKESIGRCGCAGIGWDELFLNTSTCAATPKDTGPLSLAGLKDVKPNYIANTVANDWSCTANADLPYTLLTLSPTEIERIDCQPHTDVFSGKLTPGDVMLPDALVSSAAAVSYDMGSYRDSTPDALKHILTILGLGMGTSTITNIARQRNEGFLLKVGHRAQRSYFACFVT